MKIKRKKEKNQIETQLVHDFSKGAFMHISILIARQNFLLLEFKDLEKRLRETQINGSIENWREYRSKENKNQKKESNTINRIKKKQIE